MTGESLTGPSSRFLDGTIIKEMDHDDIQRNLEAYRLAAKHVKEGGFDGIEIRMNYGLPEEFVSTWSNQRTDEYGGTLENRLRFVREVIDGVREEIGPDLIMDVRICADQVVPGGFGIEQGQEIARILAGTGKIDFINTSLGGGHSGIGFAYVLGPYPFSPGIRRRCRRGH